MMSATLSRFRRVLPAILVLFALAGGVSACAEIHPSTAPHSPNFHG